jgi:outer membrane protein assembly factor BamB
VFVVSGDAVHALATKDGATVWTAAAGPVTAPLLAQDGWVIAPVQGELAAFRADDGTEVWRQPTGTQLVRATIEGDRLYAPLTDRLLALELATGQTRWPLKLRDAPTEVLAFPDRIYLGSLDKFFYCVRAADGETAWTQATGAVLGRPAADATHVYITTIDNVVHAFDRRSGNGRWREDAPFRPTSGPVVVGSVVVVAGPSSEPRAFSAKTGTPAGHLALPQSLLVPPAFGSVKGDILMAAVTGDLTEQWNLTLMGPPLWTSPAVEPLTVLPGVTVPIVLPAR